MRSLFVLTISFLLFNAASYAADAPQSLIPSNETGSDLANSKTEVSLESDKEGAESVPGTALESEDADTVGQGKFEFSILRNCNNSQDSARCNNSSEFIYGINEDIDLGITKGLVREESGNEPAFNGVTATEIALKWKFYSNEENGLDLAVAPRYTL